jgi:methylated-DNA-protein-cysteine methyltransferase-like protein
MIGQHLIVAPQSIASPATDSVSTVGSWSTVLNSSGRTKTETDAPRFADQVFAIVAAIPSGRVTTYGDIAAALGDPRGARQVGWAIAGSPADLDLPFHRVVNRDGFLSGGWAFGHPDVMKQRLLADGVAFVDEYTVDLRRCRWIPGGDSAATDEVDDLEQVAMFDDEIGKERALDDLAVPFDDDEAFVEFAPGQERRDRRSGG